MLPEVQLKDETDSDRINPKSTQQIKGFNLTFFFKNHFRNLIYFETKKKPLNEGLLKVHHEPETKVYSALFGLPTLGSVILGAGISIGLFGALIFMFFIGATGAGVPLIFAPGFAG